MRTFRGIGAAVAAGAATVALVAGCGGSDHGKNPTGDPPTLAPTVPAGSGKCPGDDTILGYAKTANNGTLPAGAKVKTKTCAVGWIVAQVTSPGAGDATFVSQADGSHGVLGTSLCENGGSQYPSQIRALLHC